jgi:hypothetical protein
MLVVVQVCLLPLVPVPPFHICYKTWVAQHQDWIHIQLVSNEKEQKEEKAIA